MIPGEGDGQQAAAQEDVVTEIPVEGDAPETDPKVEARAREMGWRPKDSWKGDPEKWRSAEEYVKRGEEMLPILQAELRKEKAAREQERKDSAETLSRVEKASRAALRLQREQLEARYEVAKEKAVEQGDTKTYRAVDQAKKDALAKFDAEVAEPKKPEPEKGADQPGGGNLSARDKAVMDEWMTENPWYSEMRPNKVPKNPVLFAAANEAWDKIDEEEPGLALGEKLAKVKEAVSKEFPDRFGRRTNGNGSPRVESANGRGPEGGTSDGPSLWNKVPEEVRKTAAKAQIEEERVFDHLIGAKKGQPLTAAQLKMAREKYAELYFQN